MGCLIAILAIFSPRFLLIILWIFTNMVDRAFDTWIIPFLGLILAPFATVIYVLVYSPIEGVSAFGWILVFLGLFLDLGAYGTSYRGYRS
jgi:hypothetical protein